MNEPTVTMTLSRYKELESKENMMNKLITDKEIIFVRIPWQQNEYYFSSNFDQALIEIREEITKTAELAESWRKKALDK